MEKVLITHRPASIDDLDQVASIEAKSIRPPWSKDAFAKELEKKHSHFWVLTDDETDSIVHGYVVFSFPAEQAHIQTIAIKHDSRGQGFAKQLLRAVISYVLRKKGESVVLEVRVSNTAALQLYQFLGFVIIHRMKKFYPDGEDAYSLLYTLNQQKIGEADSDDQTNSDTIPKNLN